MVADAILKKIIAIILLLLCSIYQIVPFDELVKINQVAAKSDHYFQRYSKLLKFE